MKHQFYLPDSDIGKAVWLINFAAKLAVHAVTLGIAPAQVTAVTADADFFDLVVTLLTPFRDYSQSLTGYKNELMFGTTPIGDIPSMPAIPAHTAVDAGIFNRVTALVQTIKANPNYNEETIGADLGIIGSEINIDFNTIKAEPKVVIRNSHAYVSWLRNHTDAADVYADLGDGAGFTFVARVVKAHYLDPHLPATGQSKVYKYKVRYVVNDEPVGLISDEVAVTVTGL